MTWEADAVTAMRQMSGQETGVSPAPVISVCVGGSSGGSFVATLVSGLLMHWR